MREQLQRAREDGRESAERRVRERFLLDAVATQRDIAIDDEAVDARLEEMASAQGVEVAQFERVAREQGWIEAIRAEMREERALECLVDEADVEETAEP